jgi:hypothetical protein
MPGKEIWSAQFNPQRFNELDEVLRQLERRGLHPQINGYTSQLVQGKSFNNNTLCMDVSQIQWQCTPALSRREREKQWQFEEVS